MLYLSMSNDMGLYFLSVFQLPAEKTTIFILKKDHSSVLSVVELHFHFIVTSGGLANALARSAAPDSHIIAKETFKHHATIWRIFPICIAKNIGDF